MKNKNLILTFLLILLIGLFYINSRKKAASNKNIIMSAYTEGVISGADITFYDNNSMEYCSTSLTGENCYSGKYEIIKDTFFVKYSNQLPKIESTKMIKAKNKFLFLSEANEIEHKFYLDEKYID